MTPTIETERLLLRPFTRDDADDVFAYASNPNVSRYTTWATHQARSDAESFIECLLAAPDTSHTWAIRLRERATVIGSIEFSLTEHDEAEVHYALAEPFWNRGLSTEAARTVVRWGWALSGAASDLFASDDAEPWLAARHGKVWPRLRAGRGRALGQVRRTRRAARARGVSSEALAASRDHDARTNPCAIDPPNERASSRRGGGIVWGPSAGT
jgi:hypothetical protein